MSLTAFAISRDRITLTLLLVVLAGGIAAYVGMPRDFDPGFTIRTAVVATYFPGASPARVEQLVTDKLEKVIQEMPELDVVRSESATGASFIWVDIKPRYREMRPIWDDLRRKVDKAIPELPDGISGPFVDDEFGDVFGIVIGMTGEGFTYMELKEYADDARDELLLIDEVAKVEIYGAQEERIFVEYNNARLAELGFSPTQLQRTLEAQNIINPGRRREDRVRRDRPRAVGELRIRRRAPPYRRERSGQLRRDLPRGRSRDLPRLRGPARTTMMRASGAPALGLAVSMIEGGNIIRLGEQVRERIELLESFFPVGIEFELLQFQPEAVERKIDEFVGNLLQAIGIVTLVMLVTLGLRTGFVVASLIPMAIVSGFLVMSALDIGLDQMSLAALIIALGMLVDNAIVMTESIMVQMAAGKSRVEAAVDSASGAQGPLLTSSLTTAAAFLPIFLAESEAGGVHRADLQGGDDHAPLFVDHRVDGRAAALCAVPAGRDRSGTGQLRLTLLPDLPRDAAVRAAPQSAGAGGSDRDAPAGAYGDGALRPADLLPAERPSDLLGRDRASCGARRSAARSRSSRRSRRSCGPTCSRRRTTGKV